MRCVAALLLAGALAPAPCTAQVINGEGTYEGSTLHHPPSEASGDTEPPPARRDGNGTHARSGPSYER